MKCAICENNIISIFLHDYAVDYCEVCKLASMKFSYFKTFVIKILRESKFNFVDKQLILAHLRNELFEKKFGITKEINPCKLFKSCPGSASKYNGCDIYYYQYYNLKFYFCFFSDIIYFQKDDIEVLLKEMHKKLFKEKVKIKLNNIYNKIKRIFILED